MYIKAVLVKRFDDTCNVFFPIGFYRYLQFYFMETVQVLELVMF